MTHKMPNEAMELCIELCHRCHDTCLGMFMQHCLQVGGKHVAPDHVRLMINCATLCQTAGDFMVGNSAFLSSVCGVCAEVCDACAKSCAALDGMESCVKACSECAASCRKMAGGH